MLAVVVAVTLRYTRFGRHLFAIGSNERTARLCGVAIERTKIAVYTIAGGARRRCRRADSSRSCRSAIRRSPIGLELDVIAAVIIGGGSLSGGKGSVVGTIAGAAIMAIIQIGCSQQGLPNWVQQIVTGAIIVLPWRWIGSQTRQSHESRRVTRQAGSRAKPWYARCS